MKKTSVDIIIVSFNTSALLKACLESLYAQWLAQTNYKLNVIVVDNASTDDSVAMVRKGFPRVEVIQLTKNVGFAAGNNVAIKKSKADYVFLFNSDTMIQKDANLDELIAYMDAHPRCAAATPAVFLSQTDVPSKKSSMSLATPYIHLDPACHRGEPTPWASLTYFLGLEKIFPHTTLFHFYHRVFGQYHQWYKDLHRIHTIDACSGAAMCVRVDAIKKVGLLDERFFMYAEDLDWCKRFRDHDYDIIFFPAARVIHYKYQSGVGQRKDAALTLRTTATFYDTMLQYYDKHYASKYPSIVRACVRAALSFKKGVS